ncbi:hypothetical protein HK101_006686, partial [Irineochytrium annulatum]
VNVSGAARVVTVKAMPAILGGGVVEGGKAVRVTMPCMVTGKDGTTAPAFMVAGEEVRGLEVEGGNGVYEVALPKGAREELRRADGRVKITLADCWDRDVACTGEVVATGSEPAVMQTVELGKEKDVLLRFSASIRGGIKPKAFNVTVDGLAVHVDRVVEEVEAVRLFLTLPSGIITGTMAITVDEDAVVASAWPNLGVRGTYSTDLKLGICRSRFWTHNVWSPTLCPAGSTFTPKAITSRPITQQLTLEKRTTSRPVLIGPTVLGAYTSSTLNPNINVSSLIPPAYILCPESTSLSTSYSPPLPAVPSQSLHRLTHTCLGAGNMPTVESWLHIRPAEPAPTVLAVSRDTARDLTVRMAFMGHVAALGAGDVTVRLMREEQEQSMRVVAVKRENGASGAWRIHARCLGACGIANGDVVALNVVARDGAHPYGDIRASVEGTVAAAIEVVDIVKADNAAKGVVAFQME